MTTATPELFIGVTSWNSSLFLGHCLRAALHTTRDMSVQIVVCDNGSTDGSAQIAEDLGVQVIATRCSQADALNRLLRTSRSPCTLLLHSDVILLSDRWFTACKSRLQGPVALVSPEDIGCGPFTRPFGIGMPESSFMLFDTAKARKARAIAWPRPGNMRWPRRVLDLYGPHVTHHLPQRLRARGYAWQPMNVLASPRSESPIYTPAFKPTVWSDELRHLRYGLGNFYSLDGEITHYHNWYDRIDKSVDPASTETTGRDGGGFPSAYVKRYTDNFLDDYTAGRLVLPSAQPSNRIPQAL